MMHNRVKEFERWPKYKEAYIKAFDGMIKERAKAGKETEWKTGAEVFAWWMSR